MCGCSQRRPIHEGGAGFSAAGATRSLYSSAGVRLRGMPPRVGQLPTPAGLIFRVTWKMPYGRLQWRGTTRHREGASHFMRPPSVSIPPVAAPLYRGEPWRVRFSCCIHPPEIQPARLDRACSTPLQIGSAVAHLIEMSDGWPVIRTGCRRVNTDSRNRQVHAETECPLRSQFLMGSSFHRQSPTRSRDISVPQR
jgi:hypothetical protein